VSAGDDDLRDVLEADVHRSTVIGATTEPVQVLLCDAYRRPGVWPPNDVHGDSRHRCCPQTCMCTQHRGRTVWSH
jgi:hypothetical protein